MIPTMMALAIVASTGPSPAELDSMLDRAFQPDIVAGMSVAVIQGDRIVWQGARGFADREGKRPVKTDTRFYIASTTKALTATAAASLAARGALDLDAPLSRVLRGVRFAPGVHPDSIRVVDLLTHTHGIDANGPVSVRVAYTGDYTYADLERALALQGPAPTGRAFAYSNLGYDLAGIVLDPAHERGWKAVLEREVLRPLGMNATSSRVPGDRLALPYDDGPGGLERIRLAKEDANMGPAGGLFSTSGDLARLLIAELNNGRVDGKVCLPANVVAATQWPRVVRTDEGRDYKPLSWGLGWDLSAFDGDTLVSRFGSFPGYGSHVSFIRSRGVGVVVLVNGGNASIPLADMVANTIYDRCAGRADAATRFADALAHLNDSKRKLHEAIVAQRAKRAARQVPLPHPLDAYAGTFVNPDWGTLELEARGDRLEARMGVAQCPVEVFDAAKEQLRVELFGGGNVVEAVFDAGATRASAIRLLGATYTRILPKP